MKRAKTWIAVLLAAVLLAGALPEAALAEESPRAGDTATVTDSAGFRAALTNESVKTIYFQGEIEVASVEGENALQAEDKVILPAGGDYESNALFFAEGVTLTHISAHEGNRPQEMEDQSVSQIYGPGPDLVNLAELVPGTVGWYEYYAAGDQDDEYAGKRVCYTMYCGTASDALEKAAKLTAAHKDKTETGAGDDYQLVFAVFGEDIELSSDVEVEQLWVIHGGLTIKDGGSLAVNQVETWDNLIIESGGSGTLGTFDEEGYLYIWGALAVADGGTVSFRGNDLTLVGELILGSSVTVPENLKCLGTRVPCLTVKWDNEDDPDDPIYDDKISMTPYDEYEVSFAMLTYKGGDPGKPSSFEHPKAGQVLIPSPLKYKQMENHANKLTLTAAGAAWNRTYPISYTYSGKTYTLPVRIELPELGCYSAPAATTANYISGWKFSPVSSNEFYICVNPDAWFMEEDSKWGLSNKITVTAKQYDEKDNESVVDDAVQCSKVKDGVWKVAVSQPNVNVEFGMTLVWKIAGREPDEEAPSTGNNIWVEGAEQLVWAGAPLTGTSNDWGIQWQDSYRSALGSTLSMKAGASREAALYLLVHHQEAENGMPAGWYCEPVDVNQIRTTGGVTVVQAGEEDRTVRITAQSSGKIIRLQEEETEEGEWILTPGSTRGEPLTVTVTSGGNQQGGGSGSSGSSSSSDKDTGSYPVSTSTRVTGGEVKLSSKNAKKGDQVTLTVEAKAGYVLQSLTVTDAKGREVELKDQGDGRFTFTMPDSKVKVTPSFVKAGSSGQTGSAGAFTDVPAGAYYADAVQWAVAGGITGGTTEATFSPNAPCTRAQTVTFLWRAAGCPAPKGQGSAFDDVPAGAYYYEAVLWAVEQGITGGVSATDFAPNAAVTRGQMAAFLHRAAGSPAAQGSGSFTDVSKDAYYASAVQWALEQGITGGTTETTFSPGANCTRAQIVTFLFRSQG